MKQQSFSAATSAGTPPKKSGGVKPGVKGHAVSFSSQGGGKRSGKSGGKSGGKC